MQIYIRASKDKSSAELCSPYSPELVSLCRQIPSRRWDANNKVNRISIKDLTLIKDLFKNHKVVIDPVINENYKVYIEEQEKKKADSQALIDIKDSKDTELIIPNSKVELAYPYQKVGIKYILAAKKCLLADEQGLGKTLECTIAAQALINEGKIKRMLVLCPNSIKETWKREALKWTSLTPIIVEGNPEERHKTYRQDHQFLIVGYGAFIGAKKTEVKNGELEITYGDYEEIKKWGPDFIVCDECNRMAEWQNQSSKRLKDLITKNKIEYLCLCNGTPFEKMRNLYGMLKLIDTSIFGNFTKFKDEFCEIGGYTGYDIVGRKNMEEVRTRVAPVLIRRLKNDVLKDLPPKVYQQYDIEMYKEQEKVYDNLEETFEIETKNETVTMPYVFQRINAFKHLCCMPKLVNPKLTSNPKLDELKRILEELTQGHKIVIFSQYKQVTDILVEELRSNKYSIAYFHGQIPTDDRQAIIDKFQEDDNCKLFISTIQAGGYGITLTAADVVIFYDRWWSVAMNAQGVDRLHRIGQKNSVLIISLVIKNSIESRIEEMLVDKRETMNDILGDEDIIKKMSHQQLIWAVKRDREKSLSET